MGEIMGKHEAIDDILAALSDITTDVGYTDANVVANYIYNREVAWKKVILALLTMTHSGPEGIAISLALLRDMDPSCVAVKPDDEKRQMIVRDTRILFKSRAGDLS